MDEGIDGQEAFLPPVETSEITAEGSTLPRPESSTWTPPVVDSTPVQVFGSPLPSPESSTVSMGPMQGLMSTLPIGQLKLEAPPRFNGARRPGAQKWLESMTTWMTLMNYPRDQWILISSTRLEGHVSSWFSAQMKSIQRGQRGQWLSWEQYSQELIKIFAPLDEEEDARRQLKELKQMGRVAGYTAKFNELFYKVPNMTEKDKFSMYFLGLVPRLQAEVGLRLERDAQRSVERVTAVAQRAEEYLKLKYTKDNGHKKKTDGDKKGRKQTPGGRQGGNVVNVEPADDTSQVNATTSKKTEKKRTGNRRTTWRGRGNGRGGRANRGPPKCFCCEGEHLLHDCPEMHKFASRIDLMCHNSSSRETPNLASPAHEGCGPGCGVS